MARNQVSFTSSLIMVCCVTMASICQSSGVIGYSEHEVFACKNSIHYFSCATVGHNQDVYIQWVNDSVRDNCSILMRNYGSVNSESSGWDNYVYGTTHCHRMCDRCDYYEQIKLSSYLLIKFNYSEINKYRYSSIHRVNVTEVDGIAPVGSPRGLLLTCINSNSISNIIEKNVESSTTLIFEGIPSTPTLECNVIQSSLPFKLLNISWNYDGDTKHLHHFKLSIGGRPNITLHHEEVIRLVQEDSPSGTLEVEMYATNHCGEDSAPGRGRCYIPGDGVSSQASSLNITTVFTKDPTTHETMSVTNTSQHNGNPSNHLSNTFTSSSRGITCNTLQLLLPILWLLSSQVEFSALCFCILTNMQRHLLL